MANLENRVLRHDAFQFNRYGEDRNWALFGWLLAAAAIMGVAFAAPVGIFMGIFMTKLYFGGTAALGFGLYNVGKLSVVHGINSMPIENPDYDSYYGHNRPRYLAQSSKYYAQKYLDLPKADRTFFPPNLLETLKQDLEWEDRVTLNKSLKQTFEAIAERDKQRAIIAKQNRREAKAHIIESTLETLEDGRKHAAIVTDTEKEMLT